MLREGQVLVAGLAQDLAGAVAVSEDEAQLMYGERAPDQKRGTAERDAPDGHGAHRNGRP